MTKNNRLNGVIFFALIGCSVPWFVSSCASQAPKTDSQHGQTESTPSGVSNGQESSGQIAAAATDQTQTKDSSSDIIKEQVAQVQKEDSGAQHIKRNNLTEACKKQPYIQYKSQAGEYIKKGWEANQAERFGVGFRDAGEYKKWKETGDQLFTKVDELCAAKSECAKQNKTDTEKKCVSDAERFGQWQDLAKRFVDKVKSVESTQPPMLCSLTPSVDDPSQCYNLLADQIEKTCQTEQCKETSICFRGVYFLDDAINQAKLACSYVGQKLSECRSYVEETGRRKAKFDQCMGKYQQLPLEILPVI